MENEIYFIADVEKIINRDRLTIRRWYTKGIFPKPVLIESHRLAWHASVIKEWIENIFKEQKRNLFKELEEGINEINEHKRTSY